MKIYVLTSTWIWGGDCDHNNIYGIFDTFSKAGLAMLRCVKKSIAENKEITHLETDSFGGAESHYCTDNLDITEDLMKGVNYCRLSTQEDAFEHYEDFCIEIYELNYFEL